MDLSDSDVTVVGFILIDLIKNCDHYTFRKWCDDVDAMLSRIASHVNQGLYSVIGIRTSKHSCIGICKPDMNIECFPEEAFAG